MLGNCVYRSTSNLVLSKTFPAQYISSHWDLEGFSEPAAPLLWAELCPSLFGSSELPTHLNLNSYLN